jgi:hypothetical protein
MHRRSLRRICAALLAVITWPALACQCGSGGIATDAYVVHQRCGGMVTAPSALGLPTAFPSACPVDVSSGNCMVSDSCLQVPSTCTDVCLAVAADSTTPFGAQVRLLLHLGLDPTGDPSVTLPDSRVRVDASVTEGQTVPMTLVPLTVTAGSVSVHLTQNRLEANFALTLTTTAGDTIHIDSGSYVASGGTETMCSYPN